MSSPVLSPLLSPLFAKVHSESLLSEYPETVIDESSEPCVVISSGLPEQPLIKVLVGQMTFNSPEEYKRFEKACPEKRISPLFRSIAINPNTHLMGSIDLRQKIVVRTFSLDERK